MKTIKEYWNYGLKTLPVQGNKSPKPGCKWKTGITDLKEYDGFGIALICGNISGGVVCLDFDNHFGDAKQNLAKFVEQIKSLYDKYRFTVQKSQSGGYHLFYRVDKPVSNQKLACRPKWDSERNRYIPDAIIETRGENGYCVIEPTDGYKVLRGSLLDIPMISEDEQKEILTAAKVFNSWYDVIKEREEKTGQPGDLYNEDDASIEDMREALRQDGWQELRDGFWRRPGKRDGISATLNRVAKGIFYNFSANGYPFEPERAYTAFQVVGLLKYKGDFKTFAQDLMSKYKPAKKHEKEQKPEKDMSKLIEAAKIDTSVKIERPPVVLEFRERGEVDDMRLFSLSNFSAISGKSKSKKTFLSSILLAAACSGTAINDTIVGRLGDGKEGVLLFDTEQSDYDAYIAAKRVQRIAARGFSKFQAYCLREHSPLERCEIIEFELDRLKDQVGYVLIDGIVDLATAFNDEEEATRVVSLLMKWTKLYNIHITNIIHQNKRDNFAKGHLGSLVEQKSECVISVEKSKESKSKSIVKNEMKRGTAEFSDFEIEIIDGLPVINRDVVETYNDDDVPF